MKQTMIKAFGYAALGAATLATFAGTSYLQQEMGFPQTEQREKPRFQDDPILLNPAFD